MVPGMEFHGPEARAIRLEFGTGFQRDGDSGFWLLASCF
jgi:hypothetical protein